MIRARPKTGFELDSLRSAVARNIFALFLLCTMAPIAAIGYVALGRASSELENQALARLRFVSKATGMLIMERLMFLDAELGAMAADPAAAAFHAKDEGVGGVGRLRESPFREILVRPLGPATAPGGATPAFAPGLDAAARKRLEEGGAVMLAQHREDGGARLYLVRALAAGDSPDRALFAEINQEYLWRSGHGLSEDGGFIVASADGRVLTSTFPGRAPLQKVRDSSTEGPTAIGFKFESGGTEYFASHWKLFMRAQFRLPDWTIVQIQSRSSILGPLAAFKVFLPRALLLVFCLVSLVSLRQIGRTLRPIERLKEATRRVGKGDFGARVEIRSRDEFQELGQSFNQMTERLGQHFQTMSTINAIGRSLSLERDNDALLERILAGAMQVTSAELGFVYISRDDDALGLELMQVGAERSGWPDANRWVVPLRDADGTPRPRFLAGHAAFLKRTVNVPDLAGCKDLDLSMNRSLEETVGHRTVAALAVPLANHDGEIIGVLELAKGRRSEAKRPAFGADDERLVESLASQAAVAYAKNRMIVELKQLFESLIELIAKAIDEKSPYTGGHCRRVPIIAMMLAEAVCAKREGNLKDFALSQEEMEELKISALLHDCGKVTTPVHVVDKATKLETIFDRINLVDARFEILRRDAEIAHLRRSPETGGRAAPAVTGASPDLEATIRQIEEDREFLRQCNVGREYMDPENIERIRAIAARYRWTGPEGRPEAVLSEDEIYNLSVTKGTLTEQDRAIINHHVVATINLLEALPYPRYLRNVPRYAGAHHERLDGSGYPRALTAADLDIQARIIAVADIFEALTDKDRPYKEGMMLSDALLILREMADLGQIDGDIVDVLIEDKLFLRYAENYLEPRQIDDEFLEECTGLIPRD